VGQTLLTAVAAFVALAVLPGPVGGVENLVREGFQAGRIRRVVAFGDSIVQGYGVRVGWPGYLAGELRSRFPGVTVINAGRAGDTMAAGASRLDRDVSVHRPDLVLVAFGLNDMRLRVPPVQFQRDTGEIVDRIRRAGGEPILLTTTRVRGGSNLKAALDRYNDDIRAVAAEKKVLLVDVYRASTGLEPPNFFMDDFHPTFRGHQELARIIYRELVR
jgi:acyl-CoA thioesterase-1